MGGGYYDATQSRMKLYKVREVIVNDIREMEYRSAQICQDLGSLNKEMHLTISDTHAVILNIDESRYVLGLVELMFCEQKIG